MTDKQAPVTITITTHDPEMLAHGAEPVSTIECDGYLVIAHIDGDKAVIHGQGKQFHPAIAEAIVSLGRNAAQSIIRIALSMLLARKDGPDDD